MLPLIFASVGRENEVLKARVGHRGDDESGTSHASPRAVTELTGNEEFWEQDFVCLMASLCGNHTRVQLQSFNVGRR